MGATTRSAGGLVLVLAAACGGDTADAESGDGTLWLEVGGDHPRLGNVLAGAQVESPTDPAAEDGEGSTEGADLADALPIAVVDPPQPPAQGGRTVVLEGGQNLYQLALLHLQNGNRWREIMELNGWSESQIAALPEGTQVQLPPE